MSELYQQSATDVVAKLKSGEVSIQETLDAVQARVSDVDQRINSLPTLCFDRASKKAKQLQSLPVEERGALCGLPVTIKDLTEVEGVRSTMGSLVFKDTIPEKSNQLVERIEKNGGVVYAKSNTPEFGAGGITFNDVFGVTRCPHNTAFSSGGSSGGAAASLASGCAWLSHGSDMAGSLRTPASFCGVTSLRPSPGTIRSDSRFLPYDVLGEEGPMARNINDLALFADAMRNENLVSMRSAVENCSNTDIHSLRIAASTNLGVTTVSDEIASVFSNFVDDKLKNCVHLKMRHPDLSDAHDAFDTLRANVFATGLEPLLDTNRDVIKPEVVWNVEYGIGQTSEQIRAALRMQGQLVNDAHEFMRNTDVLICPATSIVSAPAEVRYPQEPQGLPIPEYYRWLAIAYATTMTTLPIITLPIGSASSDTPVAIQLVGKPWGEAALFKIAAKFEQLIDRNSAPIDPV